MNAALALHRHEPAVEGPSSGAIVARGAPSAVELAAQLRRWGEIWTPVASVLAHTSSALKPVVRERMRVGRDPPEALAKLFVQDGSAFAVVYFARGRWLLLPLNLPMGLGRTAEAA